MQSRNLANPRRTAVTFWTAPLINIRAIGTVFKAAFLALERINALVVISTELTGASQIKLQIAIFEPCLDGIATHDVSPS
jgi:hypothetical protein